jgi:hypothetical protein
MMTRALLVPAVLSLIGLSLACTSSDGTSSGTGGGGAVIADACNPVTGAGCTAAGAACDIEDSSGVFVCYPPPNAVAVCGTCDDSSMTCGANLTCIQATNAPAGNCYRYCCTAADCGAGSTCDTEFGAAVLHLSNPADTVGVCVTSTSTEAPACVPPSTMPSGGACVGGYPSSLDGGTSDAGGSPDGGSLDGG